MTRTVTFYGRPGCHLCDEALTIVERVRDRFPFALEQRNIESREEWLRAYLERIPVIAIDDREAFELFVDEGAFEQALRES